MLILMTGELKPHTKQSGFTFLNVYISVNAILKCRSPVSKLIFTHTVSC